MSVALVRVCVPLVVVGIASGGVTVQLSERTDQAFRSYLQAAENTMQWQAEQSGARAGQILVTAWGGATPTPVEDGLIHDWVASVEVPGATVDQALQMFQNYADYPRMFAPALISAKVLSHEGKAWRVRMRLRRKNVVTVELDGDYDIEYRPLGEGKWAIFSRSGRLSEIEDGSPLPPGTGNGFLWRLNSYWLLAPRPGGVYLECRTISLSRDIPVGLGWLIKPMISNVPRDSLRETVEAARRGLR